MVLSPLMWRRSSLLALGLVLNIPTLFIFMNSFKVHDEASDSHNSESMAMNTSQFLQVTRLIMATHTLTSLVTSTATATETLTADPVFVTATINGKPPGPAFCDPCGSEDPLCSLYGEHNLARSRVYEGANARFRRVIANAQAGNPTKIGVLGGSVTKGHGLTRNHLDNWTILFVEAWKALFPKSHTTLINGAVPATGTDYYSMCFGEHIDDDVDLIIIELLINDQRIEQNAVSYEWLIRGLLALPKTPAVINLHTIGLSFDAITTGGDLHTPISEYYDCPVISLRSMLLSHVLEHADLTKYYFHPMEDGTTDLRHVNLNGHKVMADLMIAYTQRQICAVEKEKAMPKTFSPDRTIPGTDKLEAIPRLRLFQKYDHDTITGPITPMCQSIRTTKHPLSPIENRGWKVWTHNGREDKPYLLANEPGSIVKFEIVAALMGRVRITHLRSKTFGLGDAWCWLDEDKNTGRRIVSWWDIDNINIAFVATISENATPGKHILSCEVMTETSDPGGGHEFRLIAVDAA